METVRRGALHLITFNCPEKRNALSLEILAELIKQLDSAAHDETCSAVALTGTGEYFTSGNDLSNFINTDKPENLKLLGFNDIEEAPDIISFTKAGRDFFCKFIAAVIDFPKVLIAILNGPAVGLGVTLLPLMDIVICVDTATFWTPFIKLGMVPEGCSSYTFPRLMGHARASQLLLSGNKMSAGEAKDSGLVSRVVPSCALEAEMKSIQQLADNSPPEALSAAKNLLRADMRAHLHQVNERECDELFKRWTSEEFFQVLASNLAKKSKL